MNSLRRAIIRLAYEKPEIRSDVLPLLKRTSSPRLDARRRNLINNDLSRHGLDGNGTFRSTGDAVGIAAEVLSNYGLEPGEIFPSYELKQTTGRYTVGVAFIDPENPWSPEPVSNSVLTLSWYQRESGNYEVVAYLS